MLTSWPTEVVIAAAGLLGLAVGSFLNVVIHRLPRMMERDWRIQCAELRGEAIEEAPRFDLVYPYSHCPACARPIRPWENIPLLSFLFLRGRCAGCGQSISIRYPLVEAATGLLSAVTIWHFGPSLAGLGALLLVWGLVALSGIDLDTQLLPDAITLPLLWTGLLLNLANTYTSVSAAVAGAAVGYLVLWAVYWLFKLTTGKEGMGYGDFKLLAALGAWLGWAALPLVILLSSLVGALVGVALMLFRKHGRDVPIPFGPYLAAAGAIALFWGNHLTTAYLQLLSF